MGFQWGPTDDRGISEIYGTILIISLVFVTAIALVGVGAFVLDDTTNNANNRLAQDSILELDNRLTQLSDDQAANTVTWEIPQGTGDDFSVDSDAGKINVTVRTNERYWKAGPEDGKLVEAGDPVNSSGEIPLGTITHESDDGVTTVYQGGGILKIEDGEPTVLRKPNIGVTNDSLSLRLFDLSSIQGVGEGEEVELSRDAERRNTNAVQEMVDDAMRNDGEIVAPVTVNMTVTTEYADAWETFAEEQGFDTYDTGKSNQVGIEFEEVGNGVDLPESDDWDDNVIYSGVSRLGPELHSDNGEISEIGSAGFEVEDPDNHTVGVHVPTAATDESPEWWAYNDTLGSDGKWENVERSNEEIEPRADGFPDVTRNIDGNTEYEISGETIVCVVDGNSKSLQNAVTPHRSGGCLEHSVGGNETALEADLNPYLAVSEVEVSPETGELLARDRGDTVDVTVGVENTGPGNANDEPVGAFLKDDSVGEFVRAGETISLDIGEKTELDAEIDPGFLLNNPATESTTFEVGGATADDRETLGSWVLVQNGASMDDIRIESIELDRDAIVAGETISGEVSFRNMGDTEVSVSALVSAGPNSQGINSPEISPSRTRDVEFDLNTNSESTDFEEVVVEIPGVDDESEPITVVEPGTAPKFVVRETRFTTPTTVSTGDRISINATIENVGAVSSAQPIQFATVDDSGDASATVAVEGAVELDPGESQEVQLNWDTTPRDIGEYDVSVFTAQDSGSIDSVEIEPAPDTDANFEVDIVDTTEPVTASERLEVDVNVTNTGSEGAERFVWLSEEGEFAALNRTSLFVPPGDSTEVTLYWDTDRNDAGDPTVVAETQDDDDTEEVTIEAPSAEADLEITNLERNAPADGTMTAGQQATVTATVRNPAGEDGDLSGSSLVILEDITGSVTDTAETGLLTPGEATDVELAWQSFPGDEGEGKLTATVDGDAGNVDLEVEPQRGNRDPLDVSFVHDESGSMAYSDPEAKRIGVTKDFVGELDASKDRVGYVQFDGDAEVVTSLTNNFGAFKSSLFPVAGGQTDITGGVIKGLESLGLVEGEQSKEGKEVVTLSHNQAAFVNPEDESRYFAGPGESVLLEENCFAFICEQDTAKVYNLDKNPNRDENMVLLGDGRHNPTSGIFDLLFADPVRPELSAKLADAADVPIYTVGLGEDIRNDEGEATLEMLADQTGGEYFFAENAGELSEEFGNVQEEVIEVENPQLYAEIDEDSLPETNLGEDVSVTVDVTNTGNVSGERPVWLVEEFSGTPVDSATVDLEPAPDPGSSTTVTLTWEDIEVSDSQFDDGSPPTATDDLTVRTAATSDSAELSVTDPPSNFEITDAELANSGEEPIPSDGEVQIEATVENTESGFDEQSIFLRAPWGAPIDSQSLELSGGEEKPVTFSWDLSDVSLTREELTVDITSEDDEASVSGIDLEKTTSDIPEYEVESLTTNADEAAGKSIEAGEDLVVTASVRNVGGTTAEQFIQLQNFEGETVDVVPVVIPNDGASHDVTLAWNTTRFDAGVDDITVTPTVGDGDSQTVNITTYDPDSEFDIEIRDTNATEGEESITAGQDILEVDVSVTNTGEKDRAIVELDDADNPNRIPTIRDLGTITNGETVDTTLRYQTSPSDDKIDEIEVGIERYEASDTEDVNITTPDSDSDVEIDIATSDKAATRSDAVTAGSGEEIEVTVEFTDSLSGRDVVSLYEGEGVESGNLLDFQTSDGSDTATLTWTPVPGDGDNLKPRIVTVSFEEQTQEIEVYVDPSAEETTDMPDNPQEPVGIDIDEIQAS